MRINVFFITSTILLFTSVNASSTKAIFLHEPQRFLRNDTETHEEERVWDINSLSDETRTLLSNMAGATSSFDHVDGAEYNLLESKAFKDLVKHMATAISKPGEDLYTKVAEVLAVTIGNDRLARILHASGTDKRAINLQRGLVNSWATEDPPKSASLLFDDLFPPKVGEKIDNDLLRNPLFGLWHKYETDRAKRYEVPDLTVAKVLKDRFNGHDVVLMLEASTKDEETGSMATGLQNALLKDWAKEDPSSTQKMFSEFKISDIKVDRLLYSAAFKVVFKYASYAKKMSDLITAITQRYGGKSVGKILAAAVKEDDTKKMAKALLYEHYDQLVNGLDD